MHDSTWTLTALQLSYANGEVLRNEHPFGVTKTHNFAIDPDEDITGITAVINKDGSGSGNGFIVGWKMKIEKSDKTIRFVEDCPDPRCPDLQRQSVSTPGKIVGFHSEGSGVLDKCYFLYCNHCCY